MFCGLFRGRPRKVVAPAKLVEDPDSDDCLSLDVDTDENEVNSCRNLFNDVINFFTDHLDKFCSENEQYGLYLFML